MSSELVAERRNNLPKIDLPSSQPKVYDEANRLGCSFEFFFARKTPARLSFNWPATGVLFVRLE